MATLTLDPVEIERVVRDSPSTSGSYRDVWFFGDIVIKRDQYNGGYTTASQREFQNSKAFKPSTLTHNEEEWTVKFPECAMVGEYLIMERVQHPHPRGEGCTQCTPRKDYDWYYHADGCPVLTLNNAIDRHMVAQYGLYDMHTGNYMVDWEGKTVWIVDFAD